MNNTIERTENTMEQELAEILHIAGQENLSLIEDRFFGFQDEENSIYIEEQKEEKKKEITFEEYRKEVESFLSFFMANTDNIAFLAKEEGTDFQNKSININNDGLDNAVYYRKGNKYYTRDMGVKEINDMVIGQVYRGYGKLIDILPHDVHGVIYRFKNQGIMWDYYTNYDNYIEEEEYVWKGDNQILQKNIIQGECLVPIIPNDILFSRIPKQILNYFEDSKEMLYHGHKNIYRKGQIQYNAEKAYSAYKDSPEKLIKEDYLTYNGEGKFSKDIYSWKKSMKNITEEEENKNSSVIYIKECEEYKDKEHKEERKERRKIEKETFMSNFKKYKDKYEEYNSVKTDNCRIKKQINKMQEELQEYSCREYLSDKGKTKQMDKINNTLQEIENLKKSINIKKEVMLKAEIKSLENKYNFNEKQITLYYQEKLFKKDRKDDAKEFIRNKENESKVNAIRKMIYSLGI